jgi:WG containing repeat
MTAIVAEPTSSLYPTFERTGSDPRKYRVGFISRNGQQVVNPLFESARPFRCGLASVMQQKKWGAIDGQGRLKIHPVSDLPLRINEDRAIYEVNGRRGVMDLAGRIILAPKYRTIGEFHEGVACLRAICTVLFHLTAKS